MNIFAKNHLITISFISILILFTIACASPETVIPPKASVTVVAPPAVPSSIPEATKSSTATQTKKVIFKDDFKDANSGWTVFTNDFGSGKYENGSYLLTATRSALPKYLSSTTNKNLTSLKSFALDIDVTMLSGSKDDHFGILVKWPDINPMGIVGYEQPSEYYFCVAPASMGAWSYTKQEIKGSSAEKSPGYFVRRKDFTCVKGLNAVNNIKIWFNPNVRFLINDYELFDLPDENMNYVNRLIKDNSMNGGTLQIGANTERVYATPSFQLHKIFVYANE